MSDSLHDAPDRQAADQEAAEIGGAHEADHAGGKPLLRAAQRHQRALQTIAAQQDAGGDEQGNERTDGGQGGLSLGDK